MVLKIGRLRWVTTSSERQRHVNPRKLKRPRDHNVGHIHVGPRQTDPELDDRTLMWPVYFSCPSLPWHGRSYREIIPD